jgi:acetyl-CoA C-acetyltransferase
MRDQHQIPVIVGGLRTPFVRSFAQYSRLSNQELLTFVVNAIVKKYHLEKKALGDSAFGGVMAYPGDWNLSREVILGTELDPSTPGYNVQRACGTSLETVIQMAAKISMGLIDSAIAGGCDTNSDVPIVLSKSFSYKLLDLRKAKTFFEKLKVLLSFQLKDFKPLFPAVMEPRTGLSMGQHTEKMVKEWGITREAQDELAFESHQKGAKAYAEGFYNDLVVEYKGVKQDTILRADTTAAKLAKLKPAFDFSGKGTLTAGNSTPLTDGAAAVLITSEAYAKQNSLPVLAKVVDAQVAAVDFVHEEGLLMGPTLAVARLCKRNQLSLQDFDFYEIHEAFAGQVLCNLKAWESEEYCRSHLGLDKALGAIDRTKMNVKGGSLAMGHPFGATGARIVASLAKILATEAQKKGRPQRGLISICTAGGMGVAAILESGI